MQTNVTTQLVCLQVKDMKTKKKQAELWWCISSQNKSTFITEETQTHLWLMHNFSPWRPPHPDWQGCPTTVSAALHSTDTTTLATATV